MRRRRSRRASDRCPRRVRCSTRLAGISDEVQGTARELRASLPAVNRALAAGTPVLKRTPQFTEDLEGTLRALRELAQSPTTDITLGGLTDTMRTLNPTLQWVGPHVTVCNYFTYFWTFLADHLSDEDTTGTVQRIQVKLAPLTQHNSALTFGATEPANGGEVDPLQHAVFGDAGRAAQPALRRGGRRERRSGLRARPARVPPAPRHRLPEQPQHRRRLAHAGPAGPDLQGPRPRARGPVLLRRADRHRPERDAMSRRDRGPSAFAVGIGVIVVAVLVTYFGFAKDIPFVNSPYEVKAAFRDASGINAGSPVRIGGVEVGEVQSVEHTSPGARSATLTLAIRKSGLPIYDDASAKIRPRIFLEGNFFVELAPGTARAGELDDGATIPVDRTASPVQFDQVLSALQSDARNDLREVFTEVGKAQDAGGARAFNESLPYQPAAYKFIGDRLRGAARQAAERRRRPRARRRRHRAGGQRAAPAARARQRTSPRRRAPSPTASAR